jgi:hypothetical protein
VVEINAQQAMAMPPPPPTSWVIENLIRTGHPRPNLLAGLPHAGKSTLAIQIAVAVANGTPVLNRRTTRGHVVYWSYEESQQDLVAALRRAGMTGASDLRMMFPEPGQDNHTALDNALRTQPTSLVLIETLGDFLGDGDLSDEEDVRRMMKKFREEVSGHHPNTAFILLVHFKKDDPGGLAMLRILGSVKIAGSTDAKIYMAQVSDTDKRRIIHAQVRVGIDIDMAYLVFDPVTNLSTLGGSVAEEAVRVKNEEKEQRKTERHAAIDQHLRDNPGITKTALAKAVKGTYSHKLAFIESQIAIGFYKAEPGHDNSQLLTWNVVDKDGNPVEVDTAAVEEVFDEMAGERIAQCTPLPILFHV